MHRLSLLLVLSAVLYITLSDAAIQNREKRERKRVGSDELCRLMAVNIPGLCGLVKTGLRWMVQDPAMVDYFSNICSYSVALNQQDRRKKRQVTEEQTFTEVEVTSFLNQYGNETGHTGQDKKFCQRMVEKTHNFCHWMLGKTVANNVRNFAWVCLLIPAANPWNVCYETVRQFGRICRATVGEENAPPKPTKPEENMAKLYSPIQTCKAFIPNFGTLCGHFQNAFELFFGSEARHILGRTCAAFLDGLKHVLPDAQASITKTGWWARTKGKFFARGSKVGKQVEKEAEAVVAAVDQNAADYSNRILKVCNTAVTAMGQACDSILGRFANGFGRLGGICVFAGRYFGECRFIVTTIQGVCHTQTNFCDDEAHVGNFTCWKKNDGFYADPVNECANYYFQCNDFLPMVHSCKEGPTHVYVAKERRCLHKADLPECHNVRSPCIPDSKSIATKGFHSSDGSGSGTSSSGTSQMRQADFVMPKVVPDKSFDCNGRAGLFLDEIPCSPFFYICETEKPEAIVKTCKVDSVDRVYVDSFGCVPKYHACMLRGISNKDCHKCYSA